MGPRLRLQLAFLGTHFAGWQRQAGQRTVQGELEKALALLFKSPVRVVGASRTDAGVHALGQVAHLDAPLPIPPQGVHKALNALLPQDVRILQVRAVSQQFHARRKAVGKRYCYRLAWGRILPPWEGLRRLWLRQRPNLELLHQALACCQGSHDFSQFALVGHVGRGARGTQRRLFLAGLRARPWEADLIFEGDGFLRGMVRRLVGAALEVALGRQSLGWLHQLLEAKPTTPVAPTAPASGLTLERVFYRLPQRWKG